jgi:pyruvate/oxaloacetate carboxyltransferase
VTPTSQIVGSQAVVNVMLKERYKVVSSEVKNYLRGQYGKAPGPVNEEIRQQILGKEKPISGRPADLLPPQMETARKEILIWRKMRRMSSHTSSFLRWPKPSLSGGRAWNPLWTWGP